MRKTIHRYLWRLFTSNRPGGEVETYCLSRKPTGIRRSSKYPDTWSIAWLAERWTIDFPDGLHRARFSPRDDPRYHIGNSEHQCDLTGIIYLAGQQYGRTRIVKHETFPVPAEANPADPDD